ncbi:MAG: class I mannose-6-phosphate isomerase [Deltaproteobacteria bacterium]|nr:class I mannose-6-phosphate isomerase [Deltaproteobacteria bacterium]
MTQLTMLKFRPLLKSIVWGGRNMETVLGRQLPTADAYGESWEIVDLEQNQSVVESGAFIGKTLGEMLSEYPTEMLGNAHLLDGRFPLLMKFIDAQQTLSVQVHPDPQACRLLKNGARPKTEAWYIIDCIPGAKLYVGLKTGVTQTQFEKAVQDGTVAELLHQIQVSKGDYVYLPSGTVHAIGDGIVLAEVQQSSNTTYRVFDWNRAGLDGAPRQLHIDEALASIHFSEHGAPRITAPLSGRRGVRCDYFSMETVALEDGDAATFESDGPIVVMCTAGAGTLQLATDGDTQTASTGTTVFVPAVQSSHLALRATGTIECVVTQIP